VSAIDPTAMDRDGTPSRSTPALGGADAALPAGLAARAEAYAALALAPATRRAYRFDWTHFQAWCADTGVAAFPTTPHILGLYLAAHAGRLAVATLERRMATIAALHQRAGMRLDLGDAGLAAVWAGIRRAHGAPPAAKVALSTEQLRQAVASLPDTMKGVRDRALLLLGYAAALRRSELVGLDVEPGGDALGWIEITGEGLLVVLRRSKENVSGRDLERVPVPRGRHAETCPVGAVEAWLARAGHRAGPLFRSVRRGGHPTARRLSGEDVARAVKAVAVTLGLDPRAVAGHSLRAGFITAVAGEGAPDSEIMAQTRHRDVGVMRRYIRRARLYQDTPARRLDL